MGLITLYVAIGFFFAWRFFASLDSLDQNDLKEVTRKVSHTPELMGPLRPVVVILFALFWPYFLIAAMED